MGYAGTKELPQALDGYRLLSAKQVASLLGVEITTVWRLFRRSQDPLPTILIGKRNRRFKLQEVLDWINRQQTKYTELR